VGRKRRQLTRSPRPSAHGALGPLLIAVVAVIEPLSMTLATRRRRVTRAASA